MRKRTLCLAITVCCFVSVLGIESAQAEEPAWEVVRRTSDGIIVKMRETPGMSVLAVKASVVVEAPAKIILDAACDPKTFHKATEYVVENGFYQSGQPNVWFNYQLLEFPVITRRDYTLRYERSMDPAAGRFRLSWRTATSKGPAPRDGIIRVTLADGRIDIVPMDGGVRSRVDYYVLADPGGNIPGWIINLANRVSVPAILRDIRDEALKRAAK